MQVVILVYIDDIVVTGDDGGEIFRLKNFLKKEFEIKNLGLLKYFLGIEVARSRSQIVISQSKYMLNLLEEIGKLSAKPADTPIEQNHSLHLASGELLEEKRMYQRLVVKLISHYY